MRDPLKYVLGSLVGALAIYGAVAACSNEPGVGDAHGAEGAPACRKWRVQGFFGPIRWEDVWTKRQDGTDDHYTLPTIDTFDLPEDWEPIGGEALGAVIARQCAAQ